MLDYKPNIVLSNTDYKVVGTRPIRHDGVDKVTGRARYAADNSLPGMLWGKVLAARMPTQRSRASTAARRLRCPGYWP